MIQAAQEFALFWSVFTALTALTSLSYCINGLLQLKQHTHLPSLYRWESELMKNLGVIRSFETIILMLMLKKIKKGRFLPRRRSRWNRLIASRADQFFCLPLSTWGGYLDSHVVACLLSLSQLRILSSLAKSSNKSPTDVIANLLHWPLRRTEGVGI